jgi:tryptophan halogenase
VYSSSFLSDEEAAREFRSRNPKVQTTRLLKFPSGRYRRSWVQNVVAVGNAAGFVEPLEATSLHVICHECHMLAECLLDSDRRPGPRLLESFNTLAIKSWDEIRWFLGIHYKFNTRLDTPFWRACRADVDIGPAAAVVEIYRENGPSLWARETVLHPNDMFGMEGYLCLLIGQQVPQQSAYAPSETEWRTWNIMRSANRARAAEGLTVQESYSKVMAPAWQWNPGYFRYQGPPVVNPR